MLKQLFCSHDYNWDSNIFGDAINLFNGKRTILKCSKCGKYKTVGQLLVPAQNAPQYTSDGYHSFAELYNHRMILFAVICKKNKSMCWKSKKHHDDTMYDNYFIVGIDTPNGQFTYHYHLKHWHMFDVKELENAPNWDGHTSDDVVRLLHLVD
ncbi:hypothetical protein [Lysinibacillus sp. BNK-21]|uniref:WDGH domain-containing protein n=1 Tax=Lysinibacillus sp. BNK-21 TaxID=3376156 RepID=UPI003B428CC1